MNYYEQVQKAVDYIEENIYEDISLEAIAKEAYCSLFHFYRAFQELIGDSMKEYIRRRRLSLAGRELRVRNDNGDNNKLIPKFWTSCMEEGIFEQFQSMTNRINPQYIDTMGMCMDFDGINTFSYLICVEATNFDYIPEGMTAKTIPGAKYVVFTAKGRIPEAIQQTWRDIYGKWFPTSGYERTNGPDFEFYDNRSEVNDDNCEVDIYIPIK